MRVFTSSTIIFCFFFNDTATTEIYTLSLHDALPIWNISAELTSAANLRKTGPELTSVPIFLCFRCGTPTTARSEEHTSELQSRQYLVCRLLLEKKKNIRQNFVYTYLTYVTLYIHSAA